MVEKLFKHMLEEKHDFYEYLMMYEHAGYDATTKATLKTLAEQESHHFKMLYDIIFKDYEEVVPLAVRRRKGLKEYMILKL